MPAIDAYIRRDSFLRVFIPTSRVSDDLEQELGGCADLIFTVVFPHSHFSRSLLGLIG